MFEFTAPDHAAISSASKILHSRYRDVVEFSDVQQELYLWLFERYDRAERWRAEYDEQRAEKTLITALRNAGERYCRNEKAEREGYEAEDEFFYSIPMVTNLLRLHFDPDRFAPPGQDLEASPSGVPANEGGNLMTMVADVGRAYEALPIHDRTLLSRVYSGMHGEPEDVYAVLGLEWECSGKAAYLRVRRVVGRLRAALGGPNPWSGDQ